MSAENITEMMGFIYTLMYDSKNIYIYLKTLKEKEKERLPGHMTIWRFFLKVGQNLYHIQYSR